jgi:hypothetical protein
MPKTTARDALLDVLISMRETDERLRILKLFARSILQQAWDCTLDGTAAQELALALGVCVKAQATQRDIDTGFEGKIGDCLYRPAGWVLEGLEKT